MCGGVLLFVIVCKMRLGGMGGEGGIQSCRRGEGGGVFPFFIKVDLGGCVH